tara:strand:- start:1336 stop:2316 length:981 start_codon:yes stop_codon:yes gene_type:complete
MQDIHKTLSKGIYGYLDSVINTSPGVFLINGWYVNEDKTFIKDFRIKEEKKYTPTVKTKLNRIDVAKYYDDPILSLSGVNVTVKTKKSNITLQGKKNNLWHDIHVINLDKYAVFWDSKFNKVNDKVPTLIAVDDFYTYPDEVRKMALNFDYNPSQYHKGKRTKTQFVLDGTKEKLEKVLGKKIIKWIDYHSHCGVFQHCTPTDPIVYHYDGQSHAAVVFLTPDAPPETGTSFYRHKSLKWLDRQPIIGAHGVNNEIEAKQIEAKFIGNEHDDFLDGTKWEEIDKIGNKYNRLAIWDAKLIHAATQYFGKNLNDSRLFHMFFFDIEQ